MRYFITQQGNIIDENNQLIPQNENNPLYQQYLEYLTNNGEVFPTDFVTASELSAIEDAEDQRIIAQLIEDGNALCHKHKERLRRRVLKGNMTLAESKTVRKLLREAHSYLRTGDFDIALDLATLIIGQPNKIQAEVTWLIEKINLNVLAK